MLSRIGVLLVFCSVFVVSCRVQAPLLNDLRDTGYNGKIKAITTNYYHVTANTVNDWHVRDTLRPYRGRMQFFRDDGNLERVAEISGEYDHNVVFEYKAGIKKGWKWVRSYGPSYISALINYKKDGGFVEKGFSGNRLTDRTRYIPGKDHRVMIKKERGFTIKRLLRSNEITRFYYDKHGQLNKYSFQDKYYRQQEELYEYEILEKDSWGNPRQVLVRKNGRPFEFQYIDITYE